MKCPSCAAEIEVDQTLAHLVVCRFCDSTVLLDDRVARLAGKMAALAVPRGPLFTGAAGTLDGKRFTVLGRIRYGYSAGLWDEWFLRFDDGTTGWISEDGEDLSFEVLRERPALGLLWQKLRPGGSVLVEQVSWHVDEKDVAVCEGGEGQLPFAIRAGRKVPFVELSRGQEFATLEFEGEGARVFVGYRLDRQRLALDRTRQEAGRVADGLEAERAAGGEDRARVVKGRGRTLSIRCDACAAPMPVPEDAGDSLECPSCHARVDLAARRVDCAKCARSLRLAGGAETRTVTCPACRTVNDVRTDEPKVLATLAAKAGRAPLFKLGTGATLRGRAYRVAAYCRYEELEEGVRYYSDEYYLRPEKGEPVWLVTERGHFMLKQELAERPQDPSLFAAEARRTFRYGGKDWSVFECGVDKLIWVDGELPWVAQVGDPCQFVDAIAPPFMLSGEKSKTEVEWYRSEYLPREEVAAAFGIPEAKLPAVNGVGPCEPFAETDFQRESWWIMLAFLAAYSLCWFVALAETGTTVARGTVGAVEAAADEVLSAPFTIPEAGLAQLSVHAPVDNAWLALDAALVDAEDKVLLGLDAEVDYYHGYEGGESWSEGSRSSSSFFWVESPGTYRLLFFAVGGFDEAAAAQPPRVDVSWSIETGVTQASYYFLGMLLTGAWVLWGWFRSHSFETERWKHSDADDDDDDD